MDAQSKTRKSGNGDHHVAISSPASSLAAAVKKWPKCQQKQKFSNISSNGDQKVRNESPTLKMKGDLITQ